MTNQTIHDRVTTALGLIALHQSAMIPMLYLDDKDLFLAMLYAYGREHDRNVSAALDALIPLPEAVAAVTPWRDWTWEELKRIATKASDEYETIAYAKRADKPDVLARHDLALKAMQNWTYIKDAEAYTAITEHHRAKSVDAAIKTYEGLTGNEGDTAEFVADLISWCSINNIDFDKTVAKACTYITTNHAPMWGYITSGQKSLLQQAIQYHIDNSDCVEHQLILDILALNGMTRLEACQYAPEIHAEAAKGNYTLAQWIVDNFTELTPTDIAEGEQAAAQEAEENDA